MNFLGRKLAGLDPADIVMSGITQVLEGRRIFAEMTVQENLMTGAHTVKEKARVDEAYDRVMGLFPLLKERLGSTAGYLSGGEQQMLAIGRALMAGPKLLILDEPSLGLAPKLVATIRDIIVEMNKQGTAVLLIEQNATMALSIAHHGYVMETGRIVLDGPAEKLLKDDDVKEFYLGLGAAGDPQELPGRQALQAAQAVAVMTDATANGPLLEVDGIRLVFKGLTALDNVELLDRPERAVRRDRPQRRRQDLDLQLPQPGVPPEGR